tara:strand:- start:203 stop:679 length:477 start_codon:yes stop_codon:yes gene_type:complete
MISPLGGGIPGFIPQHVIFMNDGNGPAMTRDILREAWNTKIYRNSNTNKVQPRAIGSFRAVMNAGDYLSRQNYSCGGGTQVTQKAPGLYGLGILGGGVHSTCDGTGIPPSTCNTKYVYDSSDYTRFKKQQAINRNYNDRSFGGDQSNASQVPLGKNRR